MARPPVGELLRDWRVRRRRSQMDVALEAGVSPRHLSFVETGRSRPSPELVLALATQLEVPLRERNALLLAAGYAPRYSHRSLDDPALAAVRRSLQVMLDAHDPFPGVVIDRRWNVVLANAAAVRLLATVDPSLLEPVPNVYRACLHPEGLAPRTVNFEDWAAYLLAQLRRTMALTGDAEVAALQAEVLRYPTVVALAPERAAEAWDDPPLLVPFRFDAGGVELSMFTTLTTFGTPLDVTLEELAVELFFPSDDATAAALRGEIPVAG